MTSPSQEQLLGYLLGALEPGEHEQFEREVAANPQLQQQLNTLAKRLRPLDVARDEHEPPVGLSSRTCTFVFEQIEERQVTPARHGLAAAMSADRAVAENNSPWTLADMVVAGGIFVAAGMLFFPAIANSRYQAQLAQCSNNFRQLGTGLIDYSSRHPRGEYPSVSPVGNRSVAGVQAAYLLDQGYLDRPGALVCPASPLAENVSQWHRATLDELDQADGPELVKLQQQVGGSTAFPLGYRERDKLGCCKKQNRENYALASDAPTGVVPHLVSNHHDGHGQNVVFESGRVKYVRECGTAECGDSLFLNRENHIEAGLCPEDIVLAVSGTPPMSRAAINEASLPVVAP
ncbi:MAG TPA: hypothetical protein VL096_06745 [Pirellulaceae bacterium]|nr:hypothetical protein [Pirellulaceae bacterium]